MTARELIEMLTAFHPDSRVRVKDPGCGCCAYEDNDISGVQMKKAKHFKLDSKEQQYKFTTPLEYLLIS